MCCIARTLGPLTLLSIRHSRSRLHIWEIKCRDAKKNKVLKRKRITCGKKIQERRGKKKQKLKKVSNPLSSLPPFFFSAAPITLISFPPSPSSHFGQKSFSTACCHILRYASSAFSSWRWRGQSERISWKEAPMGRVGRRRRRR